MPWGKVGKVAGLVGAAATTTTKKVEMVEEAAAKGEAAVAVAVAVGTVAMGKGTAQGVPNPPREGTSARKTQAFTPV